MFREFSHKAKSEPRSLWNTPYVFGAWSEELKPQICQVFENFCFWFGLIYLLLDQGLVQRQGFLSNSLPTKQLFGSFSTGLSHRAL